MPLIRTHTVYMLNHTGISPCASYRCVIHGFWITYREQASIGLYTQVTYMASGQCISFPPIVDYRECIFHALHVFCIVPVHIYKLSITQYEIGMLG